MSQAPPAAARLGPAKVIVRVGSRGWFALLDGAYRELPAPCVLAIDQIGAGDLLAAGYLADRLAGQPAETRLRTAVAVGLTPSPHPATAKTPPPPRAGLSAGSGTAPTPITDQGFLH